MLLRSVSVWILLVGAVNSSLGFSGGTGEPNDPFQIANAQELMAIGDDPQLLDKCFILIDDIDLDPNLPGGSTFDRAPVAPNVLLSGSEIIQGTPFSGHLDGRGHVIRNLTCRADTTEAESCIGLFGTLDVNAVVLNVNLESVDITARGFDYIGGLAGFNAGRVRYCGVSGTLSASGGIRREMGGLIGRQEGDLRNSYANTALYHSDPAMIGGLVGYLGKSSSELRDSYAVGQIKCLEPRRLGGLVGWNSSSILRCYAATSFYPLSLIGEYKVGPLVGSTNRDTRQCYYLAIEGLEERDRDECTPLTDEKMRQAESYGGWDFYTSNPSGRDNHWYLPTNAYPVLAWQSEYSGLVLVPEVAGLTEAQARQRLTRAGHTDVTVYHESDRSRPAGEVLFTDPARYAPESAAIGLYVSTGLYNWANNPGQGTPDDPYQISDAGQLDALHERPDLWRSHFQLQNDIDLRSRVYDKALLAYDRHIVDAEFQGTRFQGHLDGQNYAIRNLTIKSSAYGVFLGLAGYTDEGAVIERLRLENGQVSSGYGGLYVGLVAGCNSGRITRCSIQSAVHIGERSMVAGGAVGLNKGLLSECELEGALQGGDEILGGFVGRNEGRIQSCRIHTYMSIFGDRLEEIGGIVGHNSGDIFHCYVLGSVEVGPEAEKVGPLVGYQCESCQGSRYWSSGHLGLNVERRIPWEDTPPARIRYCYAAMAISPYVISASSSLSGVTGEVTGCLWDREIARDYCNPVGIGVTTRQLQDPEILGLNGWGLDPHWILEPGQDYPRLAWEGASGATIPEPSLAWLEGDGTAISPYRIVSESVLRRLCACPLLWDSHFRLESDLDLGDADWPVWGPNWHAAFTGSFEGGGHCIWNMRIGVSAPGGYQTGFFGYLKQDAVVRDLTISNAKITSNSILEEAGSLAGYNRGLVFNCTVTGHMDGGRCENVGVLVGVNSGTLFICRGNGPVMVGDYAKGIGGGVGTNKGTIVHSQTSTTVSVGSSSWSIGGLVGNNRGSVVNSITNGSITAELGSNTIGGLVGRNSGAVSHSYTTNTLLVTEGQQDIGRLVGKNTGSVTSAYFHHNGAGGLWDNGIGSSLTDAQMRQQNSFLDWDFVGESASGIMEIWRMPETGGYPILSTITDNVLPDLDDQGDLSSPILITTPMDLSRLYYHPFETHKLANDVDLEPMPWMMAPFPIFAGILDGGGYRIKNLSIQSAGLFRYLTGDAHVFDLGFENASVGIAGESRELGILARINRGILNSCYVRGSVQGDYYIGGLVGINQGNINDCYATVTLEGQRRSGGLVGCNEGSGRIRRSYSNSMVLGDLDTGDLSPVVGSNYGHAIHCFWDRDVAGNKGSVLGQGLTTEQLQRSETYGLNGWAESPAWVIHEGRDYPRLSWEGTGGQSIPFPIIDWLAGEGTQETPYLIDTPEQLVRLGSAGILWDKHFILTRDLDMAGYAMPPIGACPGSDFNGRFDGQGYTIRNLAFSLGMTVSYNVGLFGSIGAAGCVLDLHLVDTSITFENKASWVGCLAGRNSGLVQGCSATGSILGEYGDVIGGLLGSNYGTFEDCSADVHLNVRRASNIGKLVGYDRMNKSRRVVSNMQSL